MAFFRNDAVNRVYLHSGVHALAQAGGGVFFLVFLLRAGISIPVALLAQAAIMAGASLSTATWNGVGRTQRLSADRSVIEGRK